MTRIAILHPTYWPEVRRGSERLIHDLGVGLMARGHEVTLITSFSGRPSIAVEDGMRVIRDWRPPSLGRLGRRLEDHIAEAPLAAFRLWRGTYDIVHAFFPTVAWAARFARIRLGGPPFVFTFHGLPTHEYLVARPFRLAMQRSLAREAAAMTVLSEAAADRVRRSLLIDPTIVPGGVVCDDFDVEPALRSERRDPGPRIVCAASLKDPRKRASFLFEAFAKLRETHPDARLEIVRTPDPFTYGPEVAGWPDGVGWVEAHDTPTLAGIYAGADISVLASVDEAFGLVLVESLAAGTPVVAARSGACPEIVTNDSIGRLFEPDSHVDLARAMEQTVALSRKDRRRTREACQSRARSFDISRAIDSFEAIYAQVLGFSVQSPSPDQAGGQGGG